MGITTSSAEFLAQARKDGMDFGNVLMLGRQGMGVSSERLELILKKYQLWPPVCGAEQFHLRLKNAQWPFEVFLEILGAREVHSCDVSEFEGASIVHDLNYPIPENFREKFDVVIDGGTLEHVFNFPVAIKNAMELVKQNGRLILFTPSNNYLGHGFYQFSPELFYRIFSEDNGYTVERMIALVDDGGFSSIFGKAYFFPLNSPWYRVKDPMQIKKRGTLISELPVMLFVEAKRQAVINIFEKVPQQSDYSVQWSVGKSSNTAQLDEKHMGSRLNYNSLVTKLPPFVRWRILPFLIKIIDPLRLWRWKKRNSFKNEEFYIKS